MNQRPWKLWKKDGSPEERTMEIMQILEDTIRDHPPHPGLFLFSHLTDYKTGLYHLYIHVIEMSPFPERAIPVANKLGSVYTEFGHLLHMPSHIYVRVGNYKDAVASNQKAVEIDFLYWNMRV